MGYADKLIGQKIVVVGGTSGIGFGAAEILLEAGALVTVISSSADKVNSAVQRLNSPNAQGKVGDVLDEEAFTQLLVSLAPLDHVIFSGVDVLFRGPLAEANLDDSKKMFGVKFWGSVVVGKALAKHDIVRAGGSLTLTSGAAALRPKKGAVVHSGLNGGVITLTTALADELTAKKIRVNTVVPGLVKTELWDKIGHTKEQQEDLFAKAARELPVGFAGTPQDVAEAYLYAVRADYATGTTIVIDGGGSF